MQPFIIKNIWKYLFVIVCAWFFALLPVSAKVIAPQMELHVSLKKDEVLRAKITASKDSENVGMAKNFTLRWTLYRNKGLVVLVRYDHFPYQFILYKDYRLNQWSLNLLDPQGINTKLNQPQLKIYFKGIDDPFNDEKTIAHLYIQGFGNMSFTRE